MKQVGLKRDGHHIDNDKIKQTIHDYIKENLKVDVYVLENYSINGNNVETTVSVTLGSEEICSSSDRYYPNPTY